MPNQSKGPNLAILIGVPVAVVAIGAAIYFGGGKALSGGSPTLGPVTLKITYNGEPLKDASVTAEPVDGGQLSLGFPEESEPGVYVMMTDVEGNYEEGMAIGKYKLLVELRALNNSPSTPPLLTPEKYSTKSDTPFEITVTKAGLQNHELKMEGEDLAEARAKLQARAGGGGGGRQMAAPTDGQTPPENGSENESEREGEGDAAEGPS